MGRKRGSVEKFYAKLFLTSFQIQTRLYRENYRLMREELMLSISVESPKLLEMLSK